MVNIYNECLPEKIYEDIFLAVLNAAKSNHISKLNLRVIRHFVRRGLARKEALTVCRMALGHKPYEEIALKLYNTIGKKVSEDLTSAVRSLINESGERKPQLYLLIKRTPLFNEANAEIDSILKQNIENGLELYKALVLKNKATAESSARVCQFLDACIDETTNTYKSDNPSSICVALGIIDMLIFKKKIKKKDAEAIAKTALFSSDLNFRIFACRLYFTLGKELPPGANLNLRLLTNKTLAPLRRCGLLKNYPDSQNRAFWQEILDGL